jgi:hypothetical protein
MVAREDYRLLNIYSAAFMFTIRLCSRETVHMLVFKEEILTPALMPQSDRGSRPLELLEIAKL